LEKETDLKTRITDKAVLGMLVVLSTGCSHIPFIGKSAPSPVKEVSGAKPVDIPNEKPVQYVLKGQLVDLERLSSGGKVLVFPFAAGVGVEAGGQLDKASLMVIKGLSDVFEREDKGGLFTILTDENAREADLVIQGHITDIKISSKIGRWGLLKKVKRLSVEGKMLEMNSGKTVAIFSDQTRTGDPDEDLKALGYRLGQNIGKFLLFGVKQD
jgi:hypothetical protein